MGRRNQKIWEAIDTLLAFVSLGIIVALCLAYFLVAAGLPKEGTPDPSDWRPFLMAILTNVIPVFALFSIGFFALRTLNRYRAAEEREDLMVQVRETVTAAVAAGTTTGEGPVQTVGYPKFRDDPPWDELIRSSQTIRIVVHYFDTWLNENEAAFLDFFDRGGKLQVVVPDPGDGDLVAAIQSRFQGMQKTVLESKIRNTYDKLAQVRKRSNRKDAALEGYYVPFQPLYCGIQFDGRELVLSPYEHVRGVAVGSPAFLFHLSYFPAVRQWFEKEFEQLVSKAKNVKRS